ncbi:MAG: hypothetical protein D6768_10505 [Chloroflexi bacterium]|nr:MAG: hypothetical protein D6768_10505 [Chloroflexota bacterium]
MTQLKPYLEILKRKWWLVALTALFALSLTLLVSWFDTPRFRAHAQFVVSPGASLLSGNDRDLVNSISALDRRSIVATYAEIMNSNSINRAAEVSLNLDGQAGYNVQAVVVPDSSVIDLTVTGPNPVVAAQLANAVGEQAIIYIQDLYQAYNINVLNSATAPALPFSPTPARDAAVALFLGLIVGILLAIGSEMLGSNLPFGSEPAEVEPSRTPRPEPAFDLAPQQAAIKHDTPLPSSHA